MYLCNCNIYIYVYIENYFKVIFYNKAKYFDIWITYLFIAKIIQ